MWANVTSFFRKHRKVILIGVGVITLGYFALDYLGRESEVKLSSFITALRQGYVEEVVVEGKTVFFRAASKEWFSTALGSFPYKQFNSLINSSGVMHSFRPESMQKQMFWHGVEALASLGTLYYIKNESLTSPTSGVDFQAKVYQQHCSFDDFYGGELVKAKLREIIDFLHNSDKFQHFGARIRRGVLLYGPPGTGKTLLARALADEAHCQFIRVAASEFQEMYVGVGAKRVRELFREAKRQERGCIIFIDQIDALGSRTNALRDNHETTSTITQFLSEMDGFKPMDKVVVIASTNRLDLVDAAVLRAGRFDIKVQVNLPGKEERLGILKTLAAKKLKRHQISQETMEEVSQRLVGCSGADMEALLNESVYHAMREDSRVVKASHLSASVDEMLLKRM